MELMRWFEETRGRKLGTPFKDNNRQNQAMLTQGKGLGVGIQEAASLALHTPS